MIFSCFDCTWQDYTWWVFIPSTKVYLKLSHELIWHDGCKERGQKQELEFFNSMTGLRSTDMYKTCVS